MIGRCGIAGGAKAVVLLLIFAAGLAAVLLAGRIWLSKFENPEELSKRLGELAGSSVRLEEVHASPLRGKVVLGGFEMDAYTSVNSAELDVAPFDLVRGNWVFGDVELHGPVWRLPAPGSEMEPFTKGLLLPLSLATRAKSVALSDGVLLSLSGEDTVAKGIRGKFSSADLPHDGAPVKASVECVVRGAGPVSVKGTYLASVSSDTVHIEDLLLEMLGLSFAGEMVGSYESPAWARAEMDSKDFFDGSLTMSAAFRESARSPACEAHLLMAGVDGSELLRAAGAADLLSSGVLNADIIIDRKTESHHEGVSFPVRAEGKVEVRDATLNTAGPLRDLATVLQQGGASSIESGRGHFVVSPLGIQVGDIAVTTSGMKWTGSLRAKWDGSLSGRLLGRIPAQAIGAPDTPAGLVAGMLAGRDGRIPAAFTVGGVVERPTLSFDVDGTADAIAASGMPQAKRLLEGLSPSDKEEIARAVNDFFAKTVRR